LSTGGRGSFFFFADQRFRAVVFVDFVERFPLGQVFGPVKTLAALAATVGAIGQEKKDPEFQKAPALGAMHMVASAQRTISFPGVDEETKFAFHWQRIIAPVASARNWQSQFMTRKRQFRDLERCQRLHRVMPQLAERAIH
jgi:hypothetical protein